MLRFSRVIVACGVLLALACGKKEVRHAPPVSNYSYAQLDGAVVTNMTLDLNVDFDHKRIDGVAALDIDNPHGATKLYLDTWAMRILKVARDDPGTSEKTGKKAATPWTLGDSLPLIGRPLVVDITPDTRHVVVRYQTGADARGLQWLDPEQTAMRDKPYLYTQSESILARSWIPCQDTPAVRFTYSARVHVPAGLMALMSARNPRSVHPDGVYTFTMPQSIPSYLLALAVGDIEYRPISRRCGVYAEPNRVNDALWEFIDMEKMVETAEKLYGPYRWGQFDVLVLPPAFPYGGMENPRLTFLTPVLLAGDRSLVSTVAHELAHSWSGNLVTMADWDDFWLNEGFTTYFERRITEALYGRDIAEMEAVLGYKELLDEIKAAGPGSKDTALHIPLDGRDPDQVLGIAPYEKGYLFLRMLEGTVGRKRFDTFLRKYFDTFSFQPMTTGRFLKYMKSELLDNNEELAATLKLHDWAYEGGLPDNAPRPESARFARVEEEAKRFTRGAPASDLDTGQWTSMEWQQFLAQFDTLETAQMADLDTAFHFTKRNGEIQRSWYLLCITSQYEPDYPLMEKYLVRIGRRWLIRPIYTRLCETKDGRRRALRIYRRARPGYHSITRDTIDKIVDWKAANRRN